MFQCADNNTMTICIIGIDCATDDKKVGLARGFLSSERLVIDRLAKPAANLGVSEVVAGWIEPGRRTLLAMDAPLGWPEALGRQLHDHRAGQFIDVEPNLLFRRQTDIFVKQQVGKLPLDVGADRIARTAHAALKHLHDLGRRIGGEIPLVWNADFSSAVAAVEVYPAATLKIVGCRSNGYKKPEHTGERNEIVAALANDIEFAADTALMIGDDDVLDAAVCLLAGCYFLRNQCYPPVDMELAKKEGWIWVKAQNDD